MCGQQSIPNGHDDNILEREDQQLRVQYIFEPPDDGRASPKHVEEFYLIGRQNIIYVYLSWTNKEITLVIDVLKQCRQCLQAKKSLALPDAADEATTLPQNIGNYLPVNMV